MHSPIMVHPIRTSIEPRNTRGSSENIRGWKAISSTSRWWRGSLLRLMGIGRAAKLKSSPRCIQPGMFVVRADSPYRTIRICRPAGRVWGQGVGPADPVATCLMASGEQDEDFQSIYLDRAGGSHGAGWCASVVGRGRRLAWFAAMVQAPGGARSLRPTGETARIAPTTFSNL
jgi:hypothetical protein